MAMILLRGIGQGAVTLASGMVEVRRVEAAQRKLARQPQKPPVGLPESSPWLSTPTALSKNQLSESLKLGKRGIMLPNRMGKALWQESSVSLSRAGSGLYVKNKCTGLGRLPIHR